MLTGMPLVMMLTQEVTLYQTLDSMPISKLLFLTLISNKTFMEDGIFQDSQSQQLKKLTQKLKQQFHQSLLSRNNNRILKTVLYKLIKMSKQSQLPRTLLKPLKKKLLLHQLALPILLMQLIKLLLTLMISTNLLTMERKLRAKLSSQLKKKLKDLKRMTMLMRKMLSLPRNLLNNLTRERPRKNKRKLKLLPQLLMLRKLLTKTRLLVLPQKLLQVD